MQHYRMHRLASAAALAALLSTRAAAQDTPRTPASERHPYVTPAFGLHYGSPLRASAAVGVFVDHSKADEDGMVFLLEPGLAGVEASAGYYRTIGRFGTGYSAHAAVLRTGGDPWNASPRTTYVGAELQLAFVLGVGARVGYFFRASRSVPTPHDRITAVTFTLGA
jgi:hypothetical protein